jgi:hypothetical protein
LSFRIPFYGVRNLKPIMTEKVVGLGPP